MESLNFALGSLQIFILAWARLMGLFVVAPVFSSAIILMRFRILFAFTIALCVVPSLVEYTEIVPGNSMHFLILLLKEFLLGSIVGFMVSILFVAFQLSAQFFSAQIGLSIAEIFDAFINNSISLWGYFFYLSAVLIFMNIGGMHILIKVIADSYDSMPLLELLPASSMLFKQAVLYFGFLFVMALKLSFPIVVVSTILLIALGLIGRFIPQGNILILGIPIQLSVGFIMIFATFPIMAGYFASIMQSHFKNIFTLLLQVF